MFKKTLLFLFFVGCISMLFIHAATTQEDNQETKSSNPKKEASKQPKEKEKFHHEKLVAGLASCNITPEQLEYYLKHQLNDEEKRAGLQGGAFHWKAFRALGIRYVSKVIWFFLVGNSALLSLLFRFRPVIKVALPLSIWVIRNLTSWESTAIAHYYNKLNSTFLFSCVMLYMCWDFYRECRTPSYLMIALNGKRYTSIDRKRKICEILLRHMKQNNIKPRQKGLLLEHKMEPTVKKLTSKLKQLEEGMKESFEETYVAYFKEYYITKTFRFWLNQSGFVVKSATALHLAHEAGLKTIQEKIIAQDPKTKNTYGYTFKDSASELIDSQTSNTTLIIGILKSIFLGDIPSSLLFKRKKPEDFAVKTT